MFIGRSKEIQSLNKFKDKHFIKILTGLRRCGKSSILQTIYSNINDNKIIYDFNDSRLVKKFS
jgi:predicted AAA+ superfamily ATPase